MGNPSQDYIDANSKRTFADKAVMIAIIVISISFFGVFLYGAYQLLHK